MANKKDLSKLEKVKKEKNRLRRIYKDIEPKRRQTIEGLIERAAHQRVTLDELAADLDENGYVEMFSQGDQEPYERQRPKAQVFAKMSDSYLKYIQKLTDLLPKIDEKPKENDDGFEEFVSEREDL